MSYNIEDHEDHLKNEMPFQMNEEHWQQLQQRIKDKVLAEKKTTLPKPQKAFRYKAAIGMAAGLALIVTLMIPRKQPAETIPVSASYNNPELKLDETINGLNEDELNWIHELNENELSEQAEYIENQVQL